MPFYRPAGEVLLDVTLIRDDDVRRWTVHSGISPGEWRCRLVFPHSVTVFACSSKDEAAAQVREWQAEIEAAKAEGWAEVVKRGIDPPSA